MSFSSFKYQNQVQGAVSQLLRRSRSVAVMISSVEEIYDSVDKNKADGTMSLGNKFYLIFVFSSWLVYP